MKPCVHVKLFEWLQWVISVTAEWALAYSMMTMPLWREWLEALFINENKMDILILKVKLQNMKADVEHDPLSERQIKGIQKNADYIPMKGHLELCTLKQKRCSNYYSNKKKKCFSMADVKIEERGGVRHLVDKLKHWTSWEHHVKSFGAKETRSKTLSEESGNIFKTWQTQYHLMTPFKTTFCISCCSINLLYLPNSPLLVWTQNLLNFHKNVWGLLVTLRCSTGFSPT